MGWICNKRYTYDGISFCHDTGDWIVLVINGYNGYAKYGEEGFGCMAR